MKRILFLTGVGWAPLIAAKRSGILTKPIPITDERIPVIGMGTWMTFDVGDDSELILNRSKVLQAFLNMCGGMVDSSPMYGSSEMVLGECMSLIDDNSSLFSATKVWTLFKGLGLNQMEQSLKLWKLPTLDLMQIHNMLDWETHLETLREWKLNKRIRYIGITTSHGRRHQELAAALKKEPFDFVQFTYNILDRDVEQQLLPLAEELGVAVIINRPFQHGRLFQYADGKPLPVWAREFDCTNWAQYFLKFIISYKGLELFC